MLLISSPGLLIHICIFSLFAPFFIKDSMNLRAFLCSSPLIALVSPLLRVIRNFIIDLEVLVAAYTKFVLFFVENGKLRATLKSCVEEVVTLKSQKQSMGHMNKGIGPDEAAQVIFNDLTRPASEGLFDPHLVETNRYSALA